ncbi:Actin-depolymerizing factor gmf1 [Beauveria bassiana]|uniref:Actin-depolymerizing factor gmf1 n=1 Tax=Beauveria bassiana TaxID=176275 RepID=A0A2N6NV26_BEABA|nr:Actin-depolymerizing factor gmf1 [Beauveria bassiana]
MVRVSEDSLKASESRLYTFSGETKEHLRKFRLSTSRAKDPQAVICEPSIRLIGYDDLVDKNTQEIRQDDDKTVYNTLEEIGDDLPDHSPRFVLLSYPLTLRNGAEKRNAHLPGKGAAAARAGLENLALVLAVGTHEAAHVLGEAENANARLAAKVNLLADVEQRNLLRRGDDDGAVDAARLEERVDAEVLVAGAGRRIDEHEVQVAPLDVLEELLDQAVLLGPTPDDGLVAARQHELDAHDGEVIHDPDRRPPGAADVNRLVLDAHHLWYARSADIRVHYSDGAVRVGRKRVRQQRRKCALADAALAAKDENLVLDVCEARRDDGDVGVGTLGC